MSDQSEPETVSGTFVVTHADEASPVLRDVETARIHTLASNPDLESNEVVDASLAAEPPLEVAWEVVELRERRTVDVVDSDLSPTTHERAVADEQSIGDLDRVERAGTGEIHVLSVEPAETEAAARDVLEDPETIARAARLDAVRVEVRSDAAEGVLSVRYLPD
ncbi:DUF5812 family protein [Halovivax limisalsi]|uniref:DUF5812 family protein n=1 Tax=Halovivax limisalsi TaxID=1453760 RepID=UPI001FFDCA05|nr:DUF5812 family protein [Halovivax limisalsi]